MDGRAKTSLAEWQSADIAAYDHCRLLSHGQANEMRGVEPREQRELYRSAVSEGGINIKQIVTK